MDIKKLREIGALLDKNLFPCVHDGGFVRPCEPAVSSTRGQEKENERQREKRPATEPWEWSAGRQRPPDGLGAWPRTRAWPPRRTAPVVEPELRILYEGAVGQVCRAYPGTKYWLQAEGMWLLTESSVLDGLERKATFALMIPYNSQSVARGWGFWTSPAYLQWIGPRHTNFPDGSICAFAPMDGTWGVGHNIVKLLDIYSVWALRHLHYATFGRWPGYQFIHHPYERITEVRDDEYCGCNHSDRLYSQCCKEKDAALNRVELAFDFWSTHGTKERQPPADISRFVEARENPPPTFEHIY